MSYIQLTVANTADASAMTAPKNPPLTLELADNFLKRFRGLMCRRQLPENTGLLIEPCSSIHMMFMRFPIDVIYIDKEYHVLKLVENLPTWYGLSICTKKGTWGVIELPADTIRKYSITLNSRLIVI